jgi:hypothetical protein
MPVGRHAGPHEGYTLKTAASTSTKSVTIDSLEADGLWCPMAHCNRNDNSFQDLPPLRRVRTFQKITDSIVSPFSAFHLGAFTGETMAVCVYSSPNYPALVAYNYDDASVTWTSPLQDLSETGRRRVGGILLAKMSTNGNPLQRYVFAANPKEFVAYSADGNRLWKRKSTEITPAAPDGIGGPIALRFSDAKELVTATDEGWIVKLNPVDGSIIDAYKMDTSIFVGGRLYQGTFVTFKSPVVFGNTLYLLVEFQASHSTPLHPMLSPVHLVRIELTQPGVPGRQASIKPLLQPRQPLDQTPDRVLVGVNRAGGSPSACMTSEGTLLILANAEVAVRGQLKPTITVVEDDRGRLRQHWRSVLQTRSGDAIHAAPAVHEDSRILLATTKDSIFVFRNIDTLTGVVPSPRFLSGTELVTPEIGYRAATVGVGSPFALTFDPEANELVVYTNFRVVPAFGYRPYSFLGAFTLPAQGPGPLCPLWCRPLAVAPHGNPAPGPGTFGQPALFRYQRGDGQATGLIVNTVHTGTYIFK